MSHGISLTICRFGRISYKQPTKEYVYMRFFAPKRTVQLVIILNISQIHFTPDFPFNSVNFLREAQA